MSRHARESHLQMSFLFSFRMHQMRLRSFQFRKSFQGQYKTPYGRGRDDPPTRLISSTVRTGAKRSGYLDFHSLRLALGTWPAYEQGTEQCLKNIECNLNS